MGVGAGRDLTTGSNNTAIGRACMGTGAVTGQYNVAVGRNAMTALTTGAYNTAFGSNACQTISTGVSNNAIGYDALSGGNVSECNALGLDALKVCSGNTNLGVGHLAGRYVSTGTTNTLVGAHAPGYEITTGSNNMCLGNDAGRSGSPSGSITTGSNNVVLGNNSVSNLYCADTSISSSDSRDKTDITDFTKGLDWIKALRPVTYRWDRRTWYGTDEEPYGTPDGSKKRDRLHVGFLAQEALVVQQANGYGASNDDSLIVNLTDDGMSYGMKYERLVPVLVNAIKELSAEVEQLKSQLNN